MQQVLGGVTVLNLTITAINASLLQHYTAIESPCNDNAQWTVSEYTWRWHLYYWNDIML